MRNLYFKDSLNLWKIEHLAKRLRMSPEEVQRAAGLTNKSYRHWTKKKPAGGRRHMSEPKQNLKEIQKRINHILNEIRPSEAAHCGIKGRYNYTHAQIHAGSKVIFKLDLENFYPSISHHRVFHLFKHELACSREVANILTKLCTVNGAVPQGAPTSTTIANLVCKKLDQRLLGLSKRYSIRFSRFNDDFNFSGDVIPESFKSKVRAIVQQHGFTLNKSKEVTAKSSQPQIITGLNVNRRLPRVPRETRRGWRMEKYIYDKFTSQEQSDSALQKMKRVFAGKASYLAHINRKNSNKDTFHGNG